MIHHITNFMPSDILRYENLIRKHPLIHISRLPMPLSLELYSTYDYDFAIRSGMYSCYTYSREAIDPFFEDLLNAKTR